MSGNKCIRLFADHKQIKNCIEKLRIVQRSFTGLSNILTLAGNAVRLKIVYLLKEEKELCPCDLSDILRMIIPAVTQYLRKLKDGGLVQTRKGGLTIFYSFCEQHLLLLKSFFKHIDQQTPKPETT